MHSPKYQQDKLSDKHTKTDSAQNYAKSFEIRKLQTPIAVLHYSPSKRKKFVTCFAVTFLQN